MPKQKPKPEDFRMGHAHRLKIKNSNILNVLIQHITEGREMSATQVTAGLGLLKKVMPDLNHNQNDNLNTDMTALHWLEAIEREGLTLDDDLSGYSGTPEKPN